METKQQGRATWSKVGLLKILIKLTGLYVTQEKMENLNIPNTSKELES